MSVFAHTHTYICIKHGIHKTANLNVNVYSPSTLEASLTRNDPSGVPFNFSVTSSLKYGNIGHYATNNFMHLF